MASTETTTEMTPDELLSAYGCFVEAHRRLQRVFEHNIEQNCDISGPVFEVLLRLSRSLNDQLKMSELADQLDITAGGVTRLIDRVVESGYVNKTPCPCDRRVQWVSLSESGRDKITAARRVHVGDLRAEVFSRLTPKEIGTLSRVMEQLRRPAG